MVIVVLTLLFNLYLNLIFDSGGTLAPPLALRSFCSLYITRGPQSTPTGTCIGQTNIHAEKTRHGYEWSDTSVQGSPWKASWSLSREAPLRPGLTSRFRGARPWGLLGFVFDVSSFGVSH